MTAAARQVHFHGLCQLDVGQLVMTRARNKCLFLFSSTWPWLCSASRLLSESPTRVAFDEYYMWATAHWTLSNTTIGSWSPFEVSSPLFKVRWGLQNQWVTYLRIVSELTVREFSLNQIFLKSDLTLARVITWLSPKMLSISWNHCVTFLLATICFVSRWMKFTTTSPSECI